MAVSEANYQAWKRYLRRLPDTLMTVEVRRAALFKFMQLRTKGAHKAQDIYNVTPNRLYPMRNGLNKVLGDLKALEREGRVERVRGKPLRWRVLPCPRDTNKDGDCGRRYCPHCGQALP